MQSAMQSGWRIFIFAFAGKIVASLFVAICTAIGFGPDHWAEFIVAGMPFLVSPGVVRLGFLLLASLTLASLFWGPISVGNSLSKLILIFASLAPFVVGAFYITAVPTPDRRLSQTQASDLLRVLTPIASTFPNSIQVEAVSASPDAAGYARDFMFVFHQAGLTVNGIRPNENNPQLFPSPALVALSQMRGLFIGVQGGIDINSISQKAIRFRQALTDAGFNVSITGWQGIGSQDFVFIVSYR
jgi:hypothetical protein